jgi:nucleotide-binding universal stress UspA family protein
MIKTILVCTDGSDHGSVAAQYGVHLAQKLEATVTGLHVLDSRMLEGPLMADISGWIGAQPYGTQLQQFRELLQEKGEAVSQAFTKLCEENGLQAESWVKMGHPSRVILDEEAKSELVIIGQKGEHAELVGDMMGSVVDRVARNSVKPCLVTGPAFKPIDRILVAYDGCNHASQAVHESVELAQAIGVPLVILTVAEPSFRKDAKEVSQDAMKLAQAHGCEATAVIAEGDPDDTILDQAAELACDMIVVGAHGHGRIREMFLGSTTTYLITRSDLPVMLVR